MEEEKQISKKAKIIISVVISLIAIGGVLTLVFCRDLIDFSINNTNCATFPLAMITFGKWLIIPIGVMAIASVSLIPIIVFKNEDVGRYILYGLAAIILGLSIYLYFFTGNFRMPEDIGSKIFTIISIILVFVFILLAMYLTLSAQYFIATKTVFIGVAHIVIVILIPFLQCVACYLTTLNGFWWGLLAIVLQIVPLIFAIKFVIGEF